MSYTLVSGYINIETLENNNNKREQTFMIYKERGQKLIDLPINKIIFIDYRYIEEFQTNIYTKLISINFEDMEIYKYYKKVLASNTNILSPNPNKDTALFHIIQIAKTEFIKKAIELESKNENESENESEEKSNIFAWIDFGIYKLFSSYSEFQYLISNISKYITMDTFNKDMVKIPGCWKLNSYDINNDFTRVNWYFCGGFFIGHKNVLLEFEKQVKKELTYIIENDNTLIFEINIWFRLWRNKNILFDWYYGDHNASMFVNFN